VKVVANAALVVATFALTAQAADAPVAWSTLASSPHPLTIEPKNRSFYAACGTADAALADVAQRAAAHQVERGGLPSADETSFALRATGDPHPWPRAFGMAGAGLDEPDVLAKLKPWATSAPALGTRRCGIGRASNGGSSATTAIVVDAIADLTTPLSTRARVGQWMTLEARMLVPATEVKVVLLGPRGVPKTVLASLDGDRVRSSFSVDQPGPWLAQVLATIASGPRAAVEATIYAGVEPPDRFSLALAPGEDAGKGVSDDGAAMVRMINAARASEGLGAVTRDTGLDRVALAHAEAMKKSGLVAHDVGDGDVGARLRAASVPTGRLFGENVANAPTLERAHRALWSSPSHRANLLAARYRSVGIGVVSDGKVAWVAEVFRE
jgi:uncharacterized protein YkwD